MGSIEIDCSLRRSWLDQNDNVPQVLQRKPISLCCATVCCQTSWRNGSASDSRPEGCVLKSRRGRATILFHLVSYSSYRVSVKNLRTFFNYDFLQELESHIHNQSFELDDPWTNRGERFFNNFFIRTQYKLLFLSHLNV